MPNYNTPEIQPIYDAVAADVNEIFGTADDCIARIHSAMTEEDWATWGIREGESDLEQARRCSAQLWADDPRGPTEPLSKVQVEQILAQAIADQDMATIDAQLEMLASSDWTDAELQQYSQEHGDA